VFRRGSTRDLSAVVAEFEPERVASRKPAERESVKPAPVSSIGLGVSDLTEAQKHELKVKGGVKVETVEGAAARAGIHENDVILSVDNAEVTSARQFEAAVAKLDKAKPVTLLVRQGEMARFVIVKPIR
jgi:serine protease Do